MKKVFRVFVGLGVVLFVIVIIIGCGRNISSQGEAIYAASQLPDFSKLVSADSIYGCTSLLDRDILSVLNSESGNQYVVHIIVYEKKDGKTEVVRFDDQRPPRLITVSKKSG